jgi:hypothetical protein
VSAGLFVAVTVTFGSTAAKAQQPTVANAERSVTRPESQIRTSGAPIGSIVVNVATPVLSAPDISAMPLRVAKEGSVVTALEAAGDWYRIEFNDPQRGRSIGFVQKRDVSLVAPDHRQMPPTDVSIVSLVTPRAAAAQPYEAAPVVVPSQDRGNWSPSSFRRVWIDVNLGLAMSKADTAVFYFSNIVDRVSLYGAPSRGAEFDFGGGFMFTPKVGIGVSFSGTAHEDIVGLGGGIGNTTLASGSTDNLMRSEGAVNLQVMFAALHTDNVRVRAFGGPSYFRYKADMVFDFDISRPQITDYDLVTTEGSGWGAHIGGDATYFFSRVVGLGGFARYSLATVAIPEPLSETQQDIKLGGFQTGGGLRLRF